VFASASCPSGWSEYTAARGRFLRGIDNGAGLDPDGTRTAGGTQADMVGPHTHAFPYPSGTFGGQYGLTDTRNAGSSGTWSTASNGTSETRPKNVDLLPI
jgi:hypothetical protein